MSEYEKKGSGDDSFWDLSEFARQKTPATPPKTFPKSTTEAVEIKVNEFTINTYLGYSDSKLTPQTESQSTITRFIPPHKDSIYSKKHVLLEYAPTNPLIKSVRICADKPNDSVFPENNLFIRERRALLERVATPCPRVAYYSYSPRYSQMSRGQLRWYLWWRENTRKGVFLETDESYIILYAYELVSVGEGEDKNEALRMLCSLLTNYSDKAISLVFKMMIRDMICDFCLFHGIPAPLDQLKGLGRLLTANLSIPEFFLDLSPNNRAHAIEIGITALSMYDYRKSKYYSQQNAGLFKLAMNGALESVFFDEKAFNSMMSFVNGMYGSVTVERKPFTRMINIVNKSIKIEICYFQSSGIQSAITDAMRYSENKLREHLGIKNKLHIMALNPDIKSAIDRFFEENYPAIPTFDGRRKRVTAREAETNEYDRLYDVPKTEISPEHALEIERASWDTTKILTEAFSDGDDKGIDEAVDIADNGNYATSVSDGTVPPAITADYASSAFYNDSTVTPANNISEATEAGLFAQIKAELGDIADFIKLCKVPNPTEQRSFASTHALSLDELSDQINECAANVFGDIILEDVGGAYGIIEDYIDQL